MPWCRPIARRAPPCGAWASKAATRRPDPAMADRFDFSRGLEGLEHNFLTGTLESVVKWARQKSMFPATFGLACCAIEMMATGGPHYDLARYGMEGFRAWPRQGDR